MNVKKLILTIIKQVECLDSSLICYGYQTSNASHTHFWWEISVSDFEFYMHDDGFKKLSERWHKIAKKNNFRLVFICGWKPKEERLVELMEQNNLILNVE